MKRTGKQIFLTAVLCAMATAAAAETRLNPTKMTCDDVQATIDQRGAVTLRYTSTRVKNLPLYNRYVSGSGYCAFDEQAVQANVPTIDRPHCPVYVCEHRSIDDREIFIPPGH